MRNITTVKCEKTTQNVGIYIHIPFCRSRCAYCGFVSSVDEFSPDGYIRALKDEIRGRVCGRVDSVYFGGGTPSVLPSGCLREIMSALRGCAEIAGDCEITSEANPDSCIGEFLHEAVSIGVNRLSLGVQSLCDKSLKAVNRRHDSAQAISAIRLAKKYGIENISCDLMIGLPHSGSSDVTGSAEKLCDEGITHMSVYSLSVEEGTPLHASGYKPDEDESADTYARVYEMLLLRGFERYEVSNFCMPGFECRHNVKYWTLAPYIGLGAAAHSYIGGKRTFNTSDVSRYIRGDRDEQGEKISREETLEEYIMLGLRTKYGVDYGRLCGLGGEKWFSDHEKKLCELTAAGLIVRTERGFALSENAYYVMNGIITELM